MRYYIYETKQHIAVVDDERGRYRLGRFDIFDRQPDWKGYWVTEWAGHVCTLEDPPWKSVCPRRGARLLKQGGLEL